MRNKQSAINIQHSNPSLPPFLKGGEGGLFNEKGIALVMVLVLSAIALAIMAGLIYMVTSGTQISGMEKRYKTALEAAKGGTDVAHQVINLKVSESDISNFMAALGGAITTSTSNACVIANSAYTLPDGTTCGAHSIVDCLAADWPDANRRGLCVKLKLPTECWSGCDSSLTINPPPAGDNSTYDMRFNLGNYRAHAKIVDTVWGNSSPSTEDLGGGKGVVDSGTEISTVHVPFLYTIEVDAQNPTNPAERAKLSVMYQF
jgi:hypothetical protein